MGFWQGSVFSFLILLKIPMFPEDCPSLHVCPHGWGKHWFCYEFQLQTRLCSPEHLRSGCWTCSLTCTNMNLPGIERLGRKCLLVIHFGSHWSVQDATIGIISHRLLELLLQSHTLSCCVKIWWHCVCIVSSSLMTRPPLLLLSLVPT